MNSDIDVEFFLPSGDKNIIITGKGIGQVVVRENDVVIGPIPIKKFKHICDSENSGRFEYMIDENVELQISYTIKSEESFLKYSFVVTLKQNDKTTVTELTLDVESEKE